MVINTNDDKFNSIASTKIRIGIYETEYMTDNVSKAIYDETATKVSNQSNYIKHMENIYSTSQSHVTQQQQQLSNNTKNEYNLSDNHSIVNQIDTNYKSLYNLSQPEPKNNEGNMNVQSIIQNNNTNAGTRQTKYGNNITNNSLQPPPAKKKKRLAECINSYTTKIGSNNLQSSEDIGQSNEQLICNNKSREFIQGSRTNEVDARTVGKCPMPINPFKCSLNIDDNENIIYVSNQNYNVINTIIDLFKQTTEKSNYYTIGLKSAWQAISKYSENFNVTPQNFLLDILTMFCLPADNSNVISKLKIEHKAKFFDLLLNSRDKSELQKQNNIASMNVNNKAQQFNVELLSDITDADD